MSKVPTKLSQKMREINIKRALDAYSWKKRYQKVILSEYMYIDAKGIT